MIKKTKLQTAVQMGIFTLALGVTSVAMAAKPAADEKLADNQDYTYVIGDNIPSFDPQINTTVDGSVLLRDLFEGLVNADSKGNAVPGVAESWEVSKDGKTYTFKLRKESMWSNGEPVTANDFVYAWRRLANPETASEYAWYIELMGLENAADIVAGKAKPEELGVEAVDDYTLVAKIDAARPYFPGMLTHASTFPVNKNVVEEHGSDWTKPGNLVGNGAYVLKEAKQGVHIIRERNTKYWNDKETILNKVTALIINDENAALTRYDAGELDIVSVPTGQYPQQKEKRPNEVFSFPKACSYTFVMNLGEKGPKELKNVDVRKALSYALNRDVIVEKVLKGGQYPAYSWTPGSIAGFNVPNVDYATWTQKQREANAKELLTKAGFNKDNPLKLTLNYNTSEGHKKIAIAASQMWKRIGVQVTLQNFEWKVHLEKLKSEDFQMARYSWCGDYNEASTFTDLYTSTSGHNNGKYSSEAYDALVKVSKTAKDTAPLYTEMEEILASDMPIIPLYHYTGNIVKKENIKGYPFEDALGNIYSRELYRIK